jgi:hypothetical protein
MLPYQSQAAGGYEWVCTDGEFSEEPAPDCSDCDAGTANPDAGAEVCNSCVLGTFMGDVGATECTNCPPNSNTEEEGATEVTQCMCDAGYSGDIQSAQDFCNVCIAGTYNEVSGPGDCENCPEYSTTLNEASTAVTACLCEAGHTGQIFAPSDVCTECPADTFKDSISSEPCSECPEHSSTLAGEGQTSPTACLCNAGFSGDIQSSQDACNACETDTFKKDVGTAPCDDCREIRLRSASVMTDGAAPLLSLLTSASRRTAAPAAATSALRKSSALLSVSDSCPQRSRHYASHLW